MASRCFAPGRTVRVREIGQQIVRVTAAGIAPATALAQAIGPKAATAPRAPAIVPGAGVTAPGVRATAPRVRPTAPRAVATVQRQPTGLARLLAEAVVPGATALSERCRQG